MSAQKLQEFFEREM
jgi:isocitrate dehydrogenase